MEKTIVPKLIVGITALFVFIMILLEFKNVVCANDFDEFKV